MKSYSDWVGKTESRLCVLDPWRAQALAATLDNKSIPQLGDALLPTWHWLYFHATTPQSELGPDGHAERGGFLPPVALPRRMWAGGRITVQNPLQLGASAEKTSTISNVVNKHGRSGELVFVTVTHEVKDEKGGHVIDEHDIVYREAAAQSTKTTPPQAADNPQWSQTIEPDPVMLFRYSALTFNGHRIHYDRTYCTEVEGYPGLVVHGPLIATMLVESLRKHLPGKKIKKFTYRAVSPLFDTHPFSVHGHREDNNTTVWAQNLDGGLAMQAQVELE